MKVSSLLLRHFNGIRAGLGSDEVFIDFTSLPPGLIVFDAPNGKGKTTILDSMQPFRLMPYRATSYSAEAFSYYDHTYAEARKELHFSMAGRDYKQVLSIDNERRKQECRLYVDDGGRWRALNPDGGTHTYDQAIEEVMGTPKMFFTSIFRCQDAIAISQSTKKDMNEVFAELLNSDGLLTLGKKASDVVGKLLGHQEGLRREAAPLEKILSHKEATQKDLEKAIADLASTTRATESLEKEEKEKERELAKIDTELVLYTDKVNTKEKLLNEADRKRTAYEKIEASVVARKEDYGKRLVTLREKIDKLKTTIDAASEFAGSEDKQEILAETVKNLGASIVLCDRRYVQTNKKLAGQAEYDRLLKKSEMQLQRIRTDRDHAITMAETSLQEMMKKAARLTSAPCSGAQGNFSSTCLFLEDARAASKGIPAKKEELASLRTKKDPEEERLTAEVAELQKKCDVRPSIETEAKGILSLKEGLEKRKKEAEDKLQTLTKHAAALIGKGLAEKELPERRAELSALSTERDKYLSEGGQEKARISNEIVAAEREASAIVPDEELPKKEEGTCRRGRTDRVIGRGEKTIGRRAEEALRRP